LELGSYCWKYAGIDREMDRVNPTIIMFLELAAWVYLNVDNPSVTVSAQVKQRMEAANATGIEARRAPIFPAAREFTFSPSTIKIKVLRCNCHK
jgi:hypothetical protein